MIEQLTGKHEIAQYINQQINRMHDIMLRRLSYLGEQAITIARLSNDGSRKGSYKDRTGNLRASIGYVVLRNGEVMKTGGDLRNNTKRRGIIAHFATRYPTSIVLVVVAGETYAAHVAAMGYDVLDSAELFVERSLPKLRKKLGI